MQGKKIKHAAVHAEPAVLGGVETPYASDGTTAYFADQQLSDAR